MRLAIRHETTYRFARPVSFNPHRLMLRPRGQLDLTVCNHVLDCSPPARVSWSQDVQGNPVATAEFDQPAAELKIVSRLDVVTTAPAWPLFLIDPRAHAYPFAYDEDERADLGALCRPEHPHTAVAAWARAFIRSKPTDTLSLLKDLNAGVLAAATYRPRDEEGVQPGAETLHLGSGSCRDLAALFIDAARHLGFGARAVSGYLLPSEEPAADANTTHAWAEVYLPGAGWIAFDPTHGRVGAGGLIAVAVGRRNASVMPVAGSYAGAAADFLGMTTAVEVVAETGATS